MWIAIVYQADLNEIVWRISQYESEVTKWVIDTRLPANSPHSVSSDFEAAIAAIQQDGDRVLIEQVTDLATGVEYSVRLPDGYHTPPTLDLEVAYDAEREATTVLRKAHSPDLAVVVERAALYTEWKDVD